MANNNNENDTSNRNRTSTVRYSVSSLFKIIKEQDDEKGDVLAASRCIHSLSTQTVLSHIL